ncbi:hypothetical protein BU14_0505s0012 [Porphyra umbilicalis]|uniref:Sigma 54 modulation/S30EA ribosomal protein C-terminal domain-containing protein n=1 Tax=Porphyra umbilicalis TaxID=2786 RepID=A0A1X6NSZ6_PORUM|nr:hypothetical protein BU14_0505s0012 [Porphyra umbilicalis]|eukprot:OSX71732.1 hypothetical protein BU14_0505s0012 [Porphyra umbilicalis]
MAFVPSCSVAPRAVAAPRGSTCSSFMGAATPGRAPRVHAAPARRHRGAAAAPSIAMTATEEDVRTVVTGNNIDLTESLVDYVNTKIGKPLQTFSRVLTRADVHLSVALNPSISEKHEAEVVVFTTNKLVVRQQVKSADMYASIDSVADKLTRKLRKYKERSEPKQRTHAARRKGVEDLDLEPASAEAVDAATGSADVVTDTAALDDAIEGVPKSREIVKRKVFAMPPQSLEDAVMCLEMLDHDFYVYRNKDTEEINVVYKRNHGGIGHIQPDEDE